MNLRAPSRSQVSERQNRRGGPQIDAVAPANALHELSRIGFLEDQEDLLLDRSGLPDTDNRITRQSTQDSWIYCFVDPAKEVGWMRLTQPPTEAAS